VQQADVRRAGELSRLIESGLATPDIVRATLAGIAPRDRDAFVDLALGLAAPPEDGPDLPRGCVPYLPCPVDTVARALSLAEVRASDVVIDIGSGAGRTAAMIRLLTGARVIGVEVQRALAELSRSVMARLKLERVVVSHCDALSGPPCFEEGSVFFLYCPFGGKRFEALLSMLEPLARIRELRVCCVDLPLPACRFLTPVGVPAPDLGVYRTTSHERGGYAALD